MSLAKLTFDEEGYLLSGELRLNDVAFGKAILENLFLNETGVLFSQYENKNYLVEAFNSPLIALGCDLTPTVCRIFCTYETEFEFFLETVHVDEWDRFHGITKNNLPFVFSRSGQAEFFDQLDELEDEAFTFNQIRYEPKPYYQKKEKPIHQSEYWTQVYHEEGTPGWDLKGPTPILADLLPRLKLAKSRILVLGCGEGHDAAHFANEGHLVTAVDFSEEAIRRAKTHYSHLIENQNLRFIQSDALQLSTDHNNSFDLVFEHTLFCAIDPEKRNDLVKVWHRVLVPSGFFMGIFFVNPGREGPPFGGSEWEMRERLKNKFRFLMWSRTDKSLPKRHGKELLVYAQKLTSQA